MVQVICSSGLLVTILVLILTVVIVEMVTASQIAKSFGTTPSGKQYG